MGSRRQLDSRLASPDWEAVTARVLRLAGSRTTFEQRCMAAALDAGSGAVVSHEAAAALWGLPGFQRRPVVVSRPRGGTRRPSSLARVHEPRLLVASHVTVLDGIPITSAARTIFDLAGCCHPGRVERALDIAWSRGLVLPRAMSRLVAELHRQGRRGSTLMRLLMMEREDGYIAPASGLESRFLALLEDADLPLPKRQADVGAGSWIGRVDFLYPEHKLVIEIDSALHNGSKLDEKADGERDRGLRAAGLPGAQDPRRAALAATGRGGAPCPPRTPPRHRRLRFWRAERHNHCAPSHARTGKEGAAGVSSP